MGVVRSILKAIDHVLAPPVCPVCGEALAEEREDGRLCGRCRSLVEEDGGARRCRLCGSGMDTALDFCADCAAAKRPWKAGTCAFPYEGELAQWILAYKFGGRTAMAPFFIRGKAQPGSDALAAGKDGMAHRLEKGLRRLPG